MRIFGSTARFEHGSWWGWGIFLNGGGGREDAGRRLRRRRRRWHNWCLMVVASLPPVMNDESRSPMCPHDSINLAKKQISTKKKNILSHHWFRLIYLCVYASEWIWPVFIVIFTKWTWFQYLSIRRNFFSCFMFSQLGVLGNHSRIVYFQMRECASCYLSPRMRRHFFAYHKIIIIIITMMLIVPISLIVQLLGGGERG